MTLVIGLKWIMGEGEAILLTSDSKVTTSIGVTYEMKKIYPILRNELPVAVAGAAGDTPFAKKGFETAEDVLDGYADQEWPVTREAFRKAVQEIETRLVKTFSQLRNQGIDTGFQMILGSVDFEGKASLYLFDGRGLSEPVHDKPGYAMIGSGMVTGGLLLLRMIGYEPDLDLGRVSAFMIDSVSEVDTSVGPFIGESYLMRVETSDTKKELRLGALKEEELINYKDETRARKKLIAKLWKLCDEHGERSVQKLLDSLEANSKSV